MNKSIFKLTIVSVYTAILCMSAYVAIPLPFTTVMLTAQTIVVNLIALTLPPALSAACVGIYILIGAFGVPVFSGGMSGFGALFGATGGFIFGFLLSAPVISLLKGKKISFKRYLLVTVVVGMPMIYLLGAIVLSYVSEISFIAAISAGVLPFVFLDLAKCFFCSYLAVTINKSLSHTGFSLR